MKQRVLYLITFLFLVSCTNALECLLQRDPEINERTIDPAYLDEPYSQFITAHITNDPYDDFYEYFFDIRGPLPQGLDVEFNFRNIEIYGIPKETGTFRLTVSVEIGAYDDGDNYDPNPTCNGVAERTFILSVEEL